jgi:polar amino acid transport system substrate-binding protein
MLSRRFIALLGATLILFTCHLPMALAEETAPDATQQAMPVKVGIYLNAPFIMREGDSYSGLAFELFEDAARRGNLAPTYEPYATPRELLAATAAGQIDMGIGNITITRERLGQVDFTFPWHDGGLRIMIDGDQDIHLGNLLGEMGDAGHLRAFFWLGFFIVAATILLTLFDRRFDKNFTRNWFEGIVESFYHVVSITTSGKTARGRMFGAFGRLFSAFWLVFGVAVLAYVTSSVTSVMTAAAVTNEIQSINDLRDRTVGTLDGGASELYARSIGLSVRTYDSLDAAEAGLRASEVDAVIADSMALEYHVHHTASAGLEVIGPLFDPEKYGFATGLGSPLARSVSLDLLGAHEDGTAQELRARYLGVEH